MSDLRISKIREVISPVRGTAHSAGVDCFIPEFTEAFQSDFNEKNPNIVSIRPDNYSWILVELGEVKTLLIAPGERVLIPAGIKVDLGPNQAMIMENKSGVAVKKGLIAGACVIDEDYQGEIHINLINTSNHIVAIHENEKIIQGVLFNVSYSQPVEIEESKLYDEVSERGDGGFGSTGV